jgi:hypothetical protein
MRPKLLLVVVALAVAFSLTAPRAFADTNLVNNGSFETGDFTGWTEGGNFEFSQVVSGAFYVYTGAQDGQFYATFGPVGSDGTISQTISDTAGAGYTLSFWLAAAGDDPSHFAVFWNGTDLMDEMDPNTGGNWTQFSFNVQGTGSDTLTFAFQDDPEYIALDNVSVSPAGGTTPEPSSIMLLGTGVLALGGMARRKLGR